MNPSWWLQELLLDELVTDVLVNGPGEVWVERRGALEPSGVVLDRAAIELFIEHALAPLGRRVDRTSPLVDARLPDGSRLNVVLPPLAPDGPCVTVRRFASRALPLAAFASSSVVELLQRLVRERRNLVVSGGTGAGKTSLLNALAGCIDPGERVVTIEDAAELALPGRHVVRLEARPPSADGTGQVSIGDLVRNVLRMRPDRIVVGECRGPEAFHMVQALHTGHRGALTTCHANDPADALRRLETMALSASPALPIQVVRAQIRNAVDVVVHVARGLGGERHVTAVAEVVRPQGTSGLADHRQLRTLADQPGRSETVQVCG